MDTSNSDATPSASVESVSSTSVNGAAATHHPLALSEFGQAVLDSHNVYRQCHHCPLLHWSEECVQLAQALAEHMAVNNTLKTFATQGYGQNTAFLMNLCLSGNLDEKHISMLDGVGSDKLLAQHVCDIWYREGQNYSYTNPGFNRGGCVTSHFTQMVWKGTKELGVAKLTRHGRTFAVAVYKPHGNVSDEFAVNVLKRYNHNSRSD